MAYCCFTTWIIFSFVGLLLAILRLNSRLFPFSSFLQLFCLIQKTTDFLMGDNYIRGGLSVGLAIKNAISAFILDLGKAHTSSYHSKEVSESEL